MFLVYCILISSIAITLTAEPCGYKDGDSAKPRSAAPGWTCRVDSELGLWGFCRATVTSPTNPNCGLVGVCVDSHSCTAGCGRLADRAGITTFTWSVFPSLEITEMFFDLAMTNAKSLSCSTALLINNPGQSYEYIACGPRAETETLFYTPTVVETTTAPPSSTSVPSSSVEGPASRSTTTVVETSDLPASSSSSIVYSAITSPPSDTTPSLSASSSSASSSASPSYVSPFSVSPSSASPFSASSSSALPPLSASTKLGPVMGGAIGGLTVICLTILGIVLIRHKHGANIQAILPTSCENQDRNNFADEAPLHAQELGDFKKPAELYSGDHVNTDIIELSSTEGTPRIIK